MWIKLYDRYELCVSNASSDYNWACFGVRVYVLCTHWKKLQKSMSIRFVYLWRPLKYAQYIHILLARLFVYLYVVSVFRLFYFFAEHQHITHTWFLTHSQSVLLTESAHVHTTCMQQHGNKPFHNTISNSKGVYFSLLVAQSKPKWHMYICMKLQQQQQHHQKNNRRFKSFNWRATSLSIPCAFLQRCCLWYSTIQLCVYYTYN